MLQLFSEIMENNKRNHKKYEPQPNIARCFIHILITIVVKYSVLYIP